MVSGSLSLKQACELLELSYRQGKGLWKRYRAGGVAGLQHGLCGRVSNRGHSAEFRSAVLKGVEERYGDFGATLAAEHPAADDGLSVSRAQAGLPVDRPPTGPPAHAVSCVRH